MKYTVTGTNERGETITEAFDVQRPSIRQRARSLLVRLLGMRLASRLGLSKFKYITGIKARPWTVDRDGRVNINSRKIELRAK